MGFPAIFGALKYIPATIGRKALEKVNPGFKNYFTTALSYGIDANRALDYLSERFESDAQRDHKEQLERGSRNNTLRPDELVSKSELDNASLPGKALRTAASFGAGLLGGAIDHPGKEEESRKLPPIPKGPFLREGEYTSGHHPQRGVYGVESQEFGPQPAQMGPFRQGNEVGLGPIQQQTGNVAGARSAPPAQPTSQQTFSNIIAQVSPELANYIEKHISSGSPASYAAEQAKGRKPFKSKIEQLEKQTTIPFDQLVNTIYGKAQQGQGESSRKSEFMQKANGLLQSLQQFRKG